MPHPALTYVVEAERPGRAATSPGGGEVSSGRGVLQGDRSAVVRSKHGFQEGHTAMHCVTVTWDLCIY